MATQFGNVAMIEEFDGIEVILEDVKSIINCDKNILSQRQSFKQFVAYLEQMQPILEHFENASDGEIPPALQTSLKGIASYLKHVQGFVQGNMKKSSLYWLIHSQDFNKEMEDVIHSIGQWLSLFLLAVPQETHGLTRKVDDLSHEMQKIQFKPTEVENRLLMALEQESTRFSPAMHTINATIMDLGLFLGIDPERNQEKFAKQLQLLKEDLQDSENEYESRLSVTIYKIYDSWISRSELFREQSFSDPGDDEPLPPFESFMCPLTKQVMKDPVVLQSEITYERSAIQKWFQMCRDQGNPPTCPVSCQKLPSTVLLPNLVLRQIIEEWLQRNTKVRIRLAMSTLASMSSLEEKELALDDLVRISEECSLTKYRLKEAGLVFLILRLWDSDPKFTSDLRSKGLVVLKTMAMGNKDNQDAMVEAGVLKLAVKSLGSGLVKEVESAAALIFELSKQQEYCEVIGSEKGAIIYLVRLVSNFQENVSVYNVAEQILTNLEQVDSNVLQMAETGRFQPLLMRISEGSESTQLKMASYLAQRVLVNSQKELVARTAGNVLVKMLSSDIKSKEASLGALLNLSAIEDNALVLIKSGILPPLLNIIFAVPTFHSPAPLKLKETAAATLANILHLPGNWERVIVDAEGNTLQSEPVIHKLLGLLTFVGPSWKDKILEILHEITSSPQCRDSISIHMKTGNGIQIVVALLHGAEASVHLGALKLLSSLSVNLGSDVGHDLAKANQLSYLKEVLKSKNIEERLAAASIISNLPFTESQVLEVLELDLIGWTVAAIHDIKSGKIGKSSSRTSGVLLEGLLGVLLHFTRHKNSTILQAVSAQKLMSLFREQLFVHGQPIVKQRAALGLQFLSEKAPFYTKRVELPPQNVCVSLMQFCRPKPPPSHICDVHSGVCEADTSFCLVEGNAVRPLLDLLDDDSHEVRLAAIEALSTLVSDTVNLRGGIEELIRADGVQPIFDFFFTVRTGVLQEKTIWMVERILRVKDYAQGYAMDQGLFKALIEAFKHGNLTTKELAEAALTHLKQLSGLGGIPFHLRK